MITGSYVTITRKPQFSEEDPCSRIESSKFRPMFAGVNVSFIKIKYVVRHLVLFDPAQSLSIPLFQWRIDMYRCDGTWH